MDEAPRVFMSHASDDKGRFVLDFARRLRERGVNVWLDCWEMYPGDPLVEKVFNKGIGESSAVIIVLSQYSIDKPWVKEELNAAVVKKINSGSKLIPVVLDNCEVPEALKATVWERIDDLQNYDRSLDRIVAAIFGHQEKPEIGPRPAYIDLTFKGIPGLSRIDSLVLQEFSRRALARGDLLAIRTSEVWDAVSKLGISKEDFKESCTVLCDRFILERSKQIAPEPPYFTLTEHGLDKYLQDREPEFWEQLDKVAYAIVNDGLTDNAALGERLGIDRLRVRLILFIMERRQYVRLRRAIGGHASVKEVRPALRRKLQGDS